MTAAEKPADFWAHRGVKRSIAKRRSLATGTVPWPISLAELRAVFCEALELSTPGAMGRLASIRPAKASPSCALRVEELLQAQLEASGFLQEAPGSLPDAAPEGTAVPEQLGTAVGPYTLLEQIGEGGFGIVYRAEQHQPVRREVALKVLQAGHGHAAGGRPLRMAERKRSR